MSEKKDLKVWILFHFILSDCKFWGHNSREKGYTKINIVGFKMSGYTILT